MSLRDIHVEFAELPTGLIDEPELPARLGMDETKLDDLIADVRAKGVLVPISVVRVGARYEVVAGHRRRVAAGRAQVPTIRALVYPNKESALEAIKWSENRYREEMSPAEEAAYFSELLTRECGGDTNALATLLGEKRNFIEGRLLLFAGAPEVFNALSERKINIGVAHELNKCDEKLMRDYFLDRAVREGATVSVVCAWVQQWRSSLGPGGVPPDVAAQPATEGGFAPDYSIKCYVCGKSHKQHQIRTLFVHASCQEAILDPTIHGDAPPPASHS